MMDFKQADSAERTRIPMGGIIIEVHSVREDGSIRAEDLPELKIY